MTKPKARPWDPNVVTPEPTYKGKPWEGFIEPSPEESERGRAEYKAEYEAQQAEFAELERKRREVWWEANHDADGRPRPWAVR